VMAESLYYYTCIICLRVDALLSLPDEFWLVAI
jgi:hypothetical protein